jgi:hypothetical protein
MLVMSPSALIKTINLNWTQKFTVKCRFQIHRISVGTLEQFARRIPSLSKNEFEKIERGAVEGKACYV